MSSTKLNLNQAPTYIPQVSHTYNELKELLTNSSLVPGQSYLLSNYLTTYQQTANSSILDGTEVEPLVITAISDNTFSNIAFSPSNPLDYIEYNFEYVGILLSAAIPGTYNTQLGQSETISWITDQQYTIYLLDSNNLGFNAFGVGSSSGDSSIASPVTNGAISVVVINTGGSAATGSLKLNVNGTDYTLTNSQLDALANDPTLQTPVVTISGNVTVTVFETNDPGFTPLPNNSADVPATYHTTTGQITKRIDNNNNSTPYDSRQVMFPVPQDGGGTINMLTFGDDCFNNTIHLSNAINYVSLGQACTDNEIGGEFCDLFIIMGDGNVGNKFFGYQITTAGGCSYNYCGAGTTAITFQGGNNYNKVNNGSSSVIFQGGRNYNVNGCNSSNNTFSCSNSIIGDNSNSNTIGNGCQYCAIGDGSSNNNISGNNTIIGSNSSGNVINGGCSYIVIGNNSSTNTFAGGTSKITIRDNSNNNTFSTGCLSVVVDNDSSNNTFENVIHIKLNSNCTTNTIQNSQNISLGFGCNNNQITNGCGYLSLGENSSYNQLQEIQQSTFGKNNYSHNLYNAQNIMVGDSCSYITNPNGGYITDQTFEVGCHNISFSNFSQNNYFDTQTNNVTVGNNFNGNKLYNCQNVTYGENCENNWEKDVNNLTRIDNYSNNIPWAEEADLLALQDLPIMPILGPSSSLAVAFATTRVVTGATAAFRLRRSSDDFQQDFYFDNTGVVDTSDILKFIDGNRGYVSVWYDQSGNGNNAIQGTASLQPYVAIESGMVKVRYENTSSNVSGQNLTYTLSTLPLGATGVDVSDTTVFCAYSSYVTSGKNTVYPTPTFTRRYLMSSQNSALDLFIEGDNGATPDALSLNGTSSNTLFSWCHNNYWSINSNESGTEVSSNYTTISQSPTTPLIENQFTIGNKYGVNDNPYEGDIFAFIQFTTSQIDVEITDLLSNLQPTYDLIAPSDSDINVGIVGDSITNGVGAMNNQNWPRLMNTIKKSPVVNTARSSNTYVIQNNNNYNVSLDSMVVPGKTNVLFIWLGTNDLSAATAAATTATQSYADTVDFVSARRTAGWNKVVVFTAIDRGSIGTFADFNALLTSDTTHFDGVIDVASDPRLNYYPGYGDVPQFSRPDYGYSYDTIHLTSVGYKAVSAYADDFMEKVNVQSPTYTLGRRIKLLEDALSDLSSSAILNRKAQQPGDLGVTGSIYTSVLSSSQKPLTNLIIRANDGADNLANQGDILIRDAGGFGKVYFGMSQDDIADYTAHRSSATYFFGGPASNRMDIDLINLTASPQINLNFFNDPTFGGYNSAVSSLSPGTIQVTSFGGTLIAANQGPVTIQSAGADAIVVKYIYTGVVYPAVGVGGIENPTSILHIAPGITYSSQIRLQPGIGPTSSYLHDGDMWYDGVHFYGNMAGNSVQFDSSIIIDSATASYTKTSINTAYPTAKKGYKVIADGILPTGQVYTKKDDSPTGNWSVVNSTQLS